MKKLTGTALAGGTGSHKRVQDDFYATDPQSVRDLLDVADICGEHFYEPCVGQGHIAEVLKEYYPKAKILGSDIVNRGYPNTIKRDFINDDFDMRTDWVITNPPFKYAVEFINRSLQIANKGVAMFLKIQFLEGQSRKEWFKENSPKYIYVFSKRQTPRRGGIEINPDTGKKWSSTMCFAWYVWEKGFHGDPIVKWL